MAGLEGASAEVPLELDIVVVEGEMSRQEPEESNW